ncbi:TIGR01777 family oxidoreductase [Myxococcota bacterium]|nr:TIGR01777 family oxidoreductase [Myxococcota bacterium]
MKVVITGASGMIGSALRGLLERRGDQVVAMTRPDRWDPEAGTIDRELLAREAPDAVVHLAGENIGDQRWTEERKQKLRDSRTKGTELLARTIASLDRRPRVFVSASAIGIYGNRGDEILSDESSPGTGFLAELCRDWEAAADAAREAGIRVVHPRLGVVLAREGGALQKMLLPFKLGLGGRLGSGRQWMSWVAREDVTGAILFAIEREALSGPLNVVSPHPVRNSELTKALGSALGRPTLFPVPEFGLKLAFGEMAEEALLASACVTPARLQATGFPFRFPDLVPLLRSLVR